MSAAIDWNPIQNLEVVGIDEIALKTGHRDVVVVVSAYFIGLLSERTKSKTLTMRAKRSQ
ncbi:hypothetical protein CKO25_11110 [Thiocapsa imhoffii]|uniref:Transposase n=1 Tax=Thiocapsa imhoffii TaxID=382777 RepID=A0A9X1B8R7_9GAMM|nr:hypothetical protein [Thiocapsa imhoffii]MBK1645184.1 hypothetical protein [Thiocapsa imhoffii]